MDYMYHNNPQTIGELKAAITEKNQGNSRKGTSQSNSYFVRHTQVCLQRGGAYLEHLPKEHDFYAKQPR